MKEDKIRPEKRAIVNEIRERLEGAGYLLLTDARGLNVELTASLRATLDPIDAQVQTVKNTFLGVAAKDLGWEGVSTLLEGPTTMIVGPGDVSEAAKKLKAFRQANQRPVAKGGWLDGQLLTADDVAQIASIPPREIMLGQFVGTVAAPMSQLVGVLNQKMASIVYALKAVADKKAASTGE